MSDVTKLKPCPGCGGGTRYFGWEQRLGVDTYSVKCLLEGCGLAVYAPNRETAEAVWNQRALDPDSYRAGLRAAADLVRGCAGGSVVLARRIVALETPGDRKTTAP